VCFLSIGCVVIDSSTRTHCDSGARAYRNAAVTATAWGALFFELMRELHVGRSSVTSRHHRGRLCAVVPLNYIMAGSFFNTAASSALCAAGCARAVRQVVFPRAQSKCSAFSESSRRRPSPR
jgi:hypothetical protein